MGADLFLHLTDCGQGYLRDGVVHLDEGVHLGNMDAVAVGSGHLRIDLGDGEFSRLRGLLGVVHRHAEAHKSVAVWRRQLDQRHVNRENVVAEQTRYLREIARCVVGAPGIHRLAACRADEQGVVPEIQAVFGFGVFAGVQGDHVDDFHAGQPVRLPHQFFH